MTLAMTLGACSSTASRQSDAFANPFAKMDSQNTHYGAAGDGNQPVYAAAAPVTPVQSRPLATPTPASTQQAAPVVQTFQPPPRQTNYNQAYYNQGYRGQAGQSQVAYNQPVAPAQQNYGQQQYAQVPYQSQYQAQTQYQVQPTSSPRYRYPAPTGTQNIATGSIRQKSNATPSAPAPITGFGNGWHAEGGTPIIVGQNETLRMISSRYGVPDEAIMSVNGLSSPLQLQPGMRIIIPIYDSPQKMGQVTAPNQGQAPRSNQMAAASVQPVAQPSLQGMSQKTSQNRSKSQVIDAMASAAVIETPKPPKAPTAPMSAPPVSAKVQQAAPQQSMAMAAQRPQAGALQPAQTQPQTQLMQNQPAQTQSKQLVQTAANTSFSQQNNIAPNLTLQKPGQLSQPGAAQIQQASLPSPLQTPLQKAVQTNSANSDQTPTASLESSDGNDTGSAQFRWPVRGHIIQGFSQNNDGINISVPEGTAVKAIEGGVVAYAGSELKGYGNMVLVRHPNGFVSAYANNGEIAVKRGDTVKRGQVIAKSGQSGDVSSPQLHFELRKGSKPIDPVPYLAGS